MEKKIRVTVWNENVHEKTDPKVLEVYPKGLHGTIAEFLGKDAAIEVRTATLDMDAQGLPDEVLEATDVLVWWGHAAHDKVDDALVEKIRSRVYLGKMGFVALHSAHHSKPFKAILGTKGNLTWGREQKEVMWTLMPNHPIAAGVPTSFPIAEEELYAEPFTVGQPHEIVFGSWYEDGYIFRAGMTFLRDAGKIFYFQPGHETCPSFHNEHVQRVIRNAVHWVAPTLTTDVYDFSPCSSRSYDERKARGEDVSRNARCPLADFNK